MNQPEVIYEERGRAAWLTLDREAQRNALSPGAVQALHAGLDRAEADPELRVVVVTGAGDKVFCSGADLAASFGGGDPMAGLRAYARLLQRMVEYGKPLVARVAGHCLGGGLGLVLACDLAYARQDVTFRTPEVGVGLFPLMIGALMLRHLRRKQALEMIYTGRPVPAIAAEAMGLVTRSLPEEHFETTVTEVVTAIGEQAPVALRTGRQALAMVEGLALGPALDHLCGKLGDLLATEDAAEGIDAFWHKRKPEWKGR
jgi:enoyl-CoA hydratase